LQAARAADALSRVVSLGRLENTQRQSGRAAVLDELDQLVQVVPFIAGHARSK
jgi:hypothetical protein